MKEKVLKLLFGADFVSGQYISEQLGVSRTAVWKAIRGLEEEGYEIEAVRNKGYRILGEPDLLTKAQVESHLHTAWAGRELYVCAEIDSTNNEAKRLAEAGAPHGTLVIAEVQTAGRGRRGRPWISPRGTGVWMSLLIRPDLSPVNASMLTLVMAMAIRRGIWKTAGLSCGIKWPNDVVSGGRKICGILTEMSAEPDCINHIVIGDGINVLDEAFSEDLKDTATSIYRETGKKVSRAELISNVLEAFEEYYERFLRNEDLRALQEEYNSYLLNCGREVRVLDPHGAYTGVARGINTRGDLLVETENGTREVFSGEVSVRGIYGYV